jgi:DNA polymerase-1
MQGAASDIVKKAMLDIFRECDAKMTLQVHDELVFEVPSSKSKEYQKQIKNLMENTIQLRVPLKVNVCSGKTWFDAH